MNRYVRSWLYVSGAREKNFRKALESPADAIVFDLEDSVSVSAKLRAREAASEFLAEFATEQIAVRINPPRTDFGQADLASVVGLKLGAIRIPKVESAADIALVEDSLPSGSKFELQPIIESAVGFANLGEILDTSRVNRVCLGEGDLSADLGMDRRWFDWIRLDVVLRSRVKGAWPPIQGVFSDLSDEAGLRASCETGLSQGFFGRSVIHPSQISVVNAVYTPSEEALTEARAVIDAVETNSRSGATTAVLADGRFVDSAAVRAAQRVLDIGRELANTKRSS